MSQKHVKPKSRTKAKQVSSKGIAALVDSFKPQAEKFPTFRVGDTLKVHVRIKEGDKERVQVFEGVCIKKGVRAGTETITVRKVSHGVGVERVFLLNSPKISRIDVVTAGKVRRSRLYYLRALQGRKARIERDVTSNRETRVIGGVKLDDDKKKESKESQSTKK